MDIKRIVLCWIVPGILCTSLATAQTKSRAQSSQREIDQLIKEAKRRAETGEAFTEEELNVALKKIAPPLPPKPYNYQQKDRTIYYPRLNAALLASLPKRPLTEPELKAHINNLYNRLSANLSRDKVQAVQAAAARLNNNVSKMGEMAVIAYYKGAPQEAVLLAAKATLLDVGRDINLSNLAGLLVISGAPYQAIPILKTLVAKYPGHDMVLNNLGQAYAGIGAKDSAMVYLLRCIKNSPLHPEANNTAAQIEQSKGNTTKAREYAKRSLAGAYNESAAELLGKIDHGNSIGQHLFTKANLPDYFNLFKFKKPRHQMTVLEEKQVKAEHAAFLEAMDRIGTKLNNLASDAHELGEEQLRQKMAIEMKDPVAFMQKEGMFMRPFSRTGMKLLSEKLNAKWYAQMGSEKERYQSTMKELEAKYLSAVNIMEARYAVEMGKYDCGEGNGKGCIELERLAKARCKEIDEEKNKHLAACAVAADEYYKKQELFAREEFFYGSRLGYLAAANQQLANAGYYSLAAGYINRVKELVPAVYLSPECKNLQDVTLQDNSDADPVPDCPININISLLVAKIKLNCEEFEFETGDGLNFNYKKNFKTHQSTFSIAAGLDLGKTFESDIGKLEYKGELKQAFFITFDGDNNLADAGIKFGASVSASAETAYETERGPLSGTSEESTEIGYTIGVNSGWNFDEGPLKDILAPTAVQVNPKVGMYKK